MTTVTYREGARPAPAPATALLSDTWYLTGRRLRALGRQPFVLGMGVIQPVIWLFLFGELFHKIIDIPGFGYQGSYLAYLIPGIVAMNAMSGNMWAGMSTIEEIDRGRVVAEGEPDRLKQDLDVTSLDEVYLHHAGRRYSDATRQTEVAR